MQKFDVVVIGTGSAGKTTADQVKKAGKNVAIIDKLPFGGTCSQRGCDPKKILVGAAEIVARSAQMVGKGVADVPRIDWAALMAFKKTFTEPIPERTEKSFADSGIPAFHGVAQFISPTTVQVADTQLEADYFVIATGAHPAPLGIPGEQFLTDSTGFLDLEQLPDEIVMVGGGYIAFEFAHIAARAGARVTIVHQGKLPLEGFDPDLVKLLLKATEGLGIQVLLEAKVEGIEEKAGAFSVNVKQGGTPRSVPAKLVVHAAGRPADLDQLNLDKIGVPFSKKGVVVNEYLQSVAHPTIYACGDAAEKGLPLTPLTSYEAGIVVANILAGNTKKYVDTAVPSTVFTLPPLAAVGLSEEAAREKVKDLKVNFSETADWYSSKRISEPVSGYKILIDPATDLLVGAHLLGAESDEVINILTLAINQRIPTKALADTLFAYPTRASDLSSMLQ